MKKQNGTRASFLALASVAASLFATGCGPADLADDDSATSDSDSTVNAEALASGCAQLPITSIVASVSDTNVASNAIDGNLATRWSGNGTAVTLTADLGAATSVSCVDIAWYGGNTRKASFALAVSTDGVTYTTVYTGTSSGTIASYEGYTITPVTARYVRVIGKGNNLSTWNSISELRIGGGTVVTPPPPPPPASGTDKFGVKMLNATAAGGREWYLPADPTTKGPEWSPESMNITSKGSGVFHTSGQVRMNVPSPAGKKWWRDVEMTGYFRYTGTVSGGGQSPHWELFGRGERHSSGSVDGSKINFGVAAPSGTKSWPGYPFSGSVNPHCLGSSYHGNFYITGRTLFEKEITHTEGYASQKGTTTVPFSNPTNRWFGLKFVMRNYANASSGVHLESWIDVDANGQWKKVTAFDDKTGTWVSGSTALDGCSSSPYNYKPGMLIDWAGPWVTFRSDGMETDFKSLSVREVGPIL